MNHPNYLAYPFMLMQQRSMTKEEFSEWMQRCGFSSDMQAAKALGMTDGGVRFYRTGKRSIPEKAVISCAAVEFEQLFSRSRILKNFYQKSIVSQLQKLARKPDNPD